MKYYKLIMGEEKSEKEMVCYGDSNLRELYNVHAGNSIKNWCDDTIFYFDEAEGDQLTDFIANNLAWHIVSEKVKKILQNLKIHNVEFLPITIKERLTDRTVFGYYVINIVGLTDGLDLDNSKTKIFGSGETEFLSVIIPVLVQDKLNNVHFFRVEKSEFSTFVSEDVKKSFIKNKVTGCEYLKVKTV